MKFQNELTKINLEYKQYQSSVTPELENLQRNCVCISMNWMKKPIIN